MPTISTSSASRSTSTSTPSARRSTAGRSGLTAALREADDGGRVVDVDRLAQLLAQPRGVAGDGDADVRHELQHREVPDAVMARTVGAGDAGAIEHEGDAGAVERDIHQHLIEGAVHERRVDGDDGMQPAEGEAGRRGDGVLLGDADVVHAVGEALGERQQAGGAEHRRGHRDDVVALVADWTSSSAKTSVQAGPPPDAERLPGHRVDLADRVELVGLVVAAPARSRGPSR